MNTDKAFIEWSKGPRSTLSTVYLGVRLDVWRIGGQGWRFTAFDTWTDTYIGYEDGAPSEDAACESAIDFVDANRHNPDWRTDDTTDDLAAADYYGNV